MKHSFCIVLTLLMVMLLSPQMAKAGDIDFPFICEGYEDWEEPISLQHRYVKRLDKFSCRMNYRIHEIVWLYFYKEGKLMRRHVKDYRQAIHDLHACTNFTYENTHEDRLNICFREMDQAYRTLFKLSDIMEYNKNIVTDDSFDVLVHNRRGLDIIMGQTKYDRPKRSWYDFGYQLPDR